MKLVSYNNQGQDQLAILVNGLLYDTDLMHPDLPVSMGMFLNYWEDVYPVSVTVNNRITEGKIPVQHGINYDTIEILPPVPHPVSCRDSFTFRSPPGAVGQNNEAGLIPRSGLHPVYYFINHTSVRGPGEVACMPDQLQKLDFELEVAIVISMPGKNIKAADADNYIGGFMIMNGLSARRFQMDEMSVNPGPSKGKDFAIITGPVLVTPDELEPFKVDCKPGHMGNAYNLSMTCRVNGLPVSEGNVADMEWTFAELIERCSYGVQLFPGDIIGSGAVGTGSFMELNAAGKLNNPGYEEQWLQAGDVVDLEIEELGKLTTTIVKDESDFSILTPEK